MKSETTFPVGSPWHIEFGDNIGVGCSEERLESLRKLLATSQHEKDLADFEERLLEEGKVLRWVYSQLLRLRAQPHKLKYSEFITFVQDNSLLLPDRVESEIFLALAILALKFKDDATIRQLLEILPHQRTWVVAEMVELVSNHKDWRENLFPSLVTPSPDDPHYRKLVASRLKLAVTLGKKQEGRSFLTQDVEASIHRADDSEGARDFYGVVHHLEFAIELLETFGHQFEICEVKLRCRFLRERARSARKQFPLTKFEERRQLDRHLVLAERMEIYRFRRIAQLLVAFASKAPWPNIEVEIKVAEENRALVDLFPRYMITTDGRHVTTVLSEKDNIRQRVFETIHFVAVNHIHLVVRPCFSQLKKREGFDPPSIVGEICSAGLVPEHRRVIFGGGITALFDGNYPAAAHLLVPAFEDMIRQYMIVITGGQTSSPREFEQFALLRPMLQELATTSKDTAQIISDVATWWDWYFCEPIGGNVRNDLAHGLLRDELCEEVAWMTWLSILQLYCLDPMDLTMGCDSIFQAQYH